MCVAVQCREAWRLESGPHQERACQNCRTNIRVSQQSLAEILYVSETPILAGHMLDHMAGRHGPAPVRQGWNCRGCRRRGCPSRSSCSSTRPRAPEPAPRGGPVQSTHEHRCGVQFPERGWQAGRVTISERIAATRRERRVLARVSRAARRLHQAEREWTWALVSARAKGKQHVPSPKRARQPGWARTAAGSRAGGTHGRRRAGREGVPAWSAAWTAAATSCAVSVSMAIFRRSSRRVREIARGCGEEPSATLNPRLKPGDNPVFYPAGAGAGATLPAITRDPGRLAATRAGPGAGSCLLENPPGPLLRFPSA